MTIFIENFHFLRPFWLLALVPAVFLTILIWRRQDAKRAWRSVIADHLLSHLLVGVEQRGWLRPVHLLFAAWIIGIIALSGPTWRREPSPFTEDTAALVIALEVSPTMMARDIQPSRLQRAVHKIKDLLSLRPGARTALIAYAGTAHVVMPLTRDAKIIETFAAELDPGIMPAEGDTVIEAIKIANGQLTRFGQPGSILVITDGVPQHQVKVLEEYRQNSGGPVHLLAVAPPAPALNRAALEQIADAVGGTLTFVTPDDRDVRQLAGRIETSLVAAQQTEGGERWRDYGYWLVPIITLLCLVWFRPGWVVSWE